MISSRLLVTVMLMMYCIILQSIAINDAACVCNEPGVDQCSACKEHSIVRPKPKPHETPVALPPIGDNCWCNKLRVEPAALPKPCDKHKTPYGNYKAQPQAYENTIYKAQPLSYDTPIYNNPPLNYYVPPALPTYDSPPADPVSISLAVQAGKAIGVPEAKLAFGFVQKPIDGLPKIQFSDVPEENLFKLNSEVITLKKLPSSVKHPEEEYHIEENEEEDDSAFENGVDLKLTYKQLGYETEHFINPKFRKVSTGHAYTARPNYPVKPVYAKTEADYGLKRGRIATVYTAPPKGCCSYKEY